MSDRGIPGQVNVCHTATITNPVPEPLVQMSSTDSFATIPIPEL